MREGIWDLLSRGQELAVLIASMVLLTVALATRWLGDRGSTPWGRAPRPWWWLHWWSLVLAVLGLWLLTADKATPPWA